MRQMHGDMGRGAERAIRVGVGAIRMGVRDLHGTSNGHQKNANQREEYPPRASSALSEVISSHSRTIAQQRNVWCLGKSQFGSDLGNRPGRTRKGREGVTRTEPAIPPGLSERGY